MTSRVRASILAITFAAIAAVPSIAAAQDKATFGIKGGVNFAKLGGDDIDDEDLKGLVGGAFGAFVSKAIKDNVGIRGEALWSMKGAKFEDSGVDGKIKLNYIDVAALLTAGPSSSGGAAFQVFAGPQVSFKTKAEQRVGSQTVDFSDEVKSTDFAVVLGAGVSSGRIGAEARYALGLTKIAKDGDDVKNKVFSVFLNFNLTK